MTIPTQMVTTSAFSLKNVLFYGILFFALFLILFQAIDQSIQEKSFTPIITSLGQQFFLATKNLQTSSQQILDRGVPFDNNLSLLKNIYNIFLVFSTFFTTFFIIYLWFKILYYLFSHSFFSQQGQFFISFSLSLVAFYVLNILFILVNEAILHNINSIGDVSKILFIPISCFIVFVKASYFILKSLASHMPILSDKLNLNITNLTK